MASSSLGSLRVDLFLNMAQFIDGIEKAPKALGKLESQLKSIGRGMSVAITGPLLAIGASAFAAAKQVDEAMDSIRAGTGATGKALESLGNDFKAVATSVPASLGQAAQAVTELNQRLGLTGVPLQEMSKQILNLSRLTKSDLSGTIAATTRVFGDWSIATRDQASALDFLFKTTQQTGIKLQNLTELIVQFGAPLRAFGFSFEQAAALMGKFEKEGVNLETVFSGMRFALGKFAAAGKDPANALREIIDQIKNAKRESDATAIAFANFGKKAAIDISRAILEGRFAIEDMVDALKKSGDTINGAAKATESFGEKWILVKNRVILALDPLGKQLLDVFETRVFPALTTAIGLVGDLTKAFGDLPSGVKSSILGFAGLVAILGPASLILGSFVGSLKVLVPLMVTSFTALTTALGSLSILAHVKSLGDLAAGFGLVKVAVLGAIGPFLGVAAAIGIAASAWSIFSTIRERMALNRDIAQSQQLEAESLVRNIALLQKRGIALQLTGTISEKLEATNRALGQSQKEHNNAITAAGEKLIAHKQHLQELTEEQQKFAKSVSDGVQSFLDSNRVTAEQLAIYKQLRAAGVSAAEAYEVIGDKLKKIFEVQKIIVEDGADVTAVLEKIPLIAAEFSKVVFEPRIMDDVALSQLERIDEALAGLKEAAILDIGKSFDAANDEVLIMAAGVDRLVESGKDLTLIYRQFGGLLEDQPEKLKESTRAALEMGRVLSNINDGVLNLGRGIESSVSAAFVAIMGRARDWREKMRSLLGGLKDQFLKIFGDIVGGAVRQLFNPLLDAFKAFLSRIISSMIGGAGGAASAVSAGGSTLGSISALPALFGVGGSSGGAGAAAGGGILAGLGGLGTLLGGAGLGAGIGAKVGGLGGGIIGGTLGAAGGLAALLGSSSVGFGGGFISGLGILLSNPVSAAIIGTALAAGLVLSLRHTTTRDAAKELGRDFGGVATSAKTFEGFLQAINLTSKQAEGIRKDLLSSPKFLTEVAFPLAQAQGKTEDFLRSLENIQTVMGNFNFRAAFEAGLKSGDFSALNKAFEAAFKDSKALVQIIPDFAKRLAASTEGAIEGPLVRTRLKFHTVAVAGPGPFRTPTDNSGGLIPPGGGSGGGDTDGGGDTGGGGDRRDDIPMESRGLIVMYAPNISGAYDAASMETLQREVIFPNFVRHLRGNISGIKVATVKALEGR